MVTYMQVLNYNNYSINNTLEGNKKVNTISTIASWMSNN